MAILVLLSYICFILSPLNMKRSNRYHSRCHFYFWSNAFTLTLTRFLTIFRDFIGDSRFDSSWVTGVVGVRYRCSIERDTFQIWMNWRTFIWALWVAAVTFVSAEKGLEFPVHDGKDRLVNLRCVWWYFRRDKTTSNSQIKFNYSHNFDYWYSLRWQRRSV